MNLNFGCYNVARNDTPPHATVAQLILTIDTNCSNTHAHSGISRRQGSCEWTWELQTAWARTQVNVDFDYSNTTCLNSPKNHLQNACLLHCNTTLWPKHPDVLSNVCVKTKSSLFGFDKFVCKEEKPVPSSSCVTVGGSITRIWTRFAQNSTI